MTTIDKLGGTEIVKDNDLLPVFQPRNRRTRNLSVKDLAEYFNKTSTVVSVDGRVGVVSLNDLYAPAPHVGSSGVSQHALVQDGGSAGFMSGAQSAKLTAIQAGAQNNTASNVGSGAGVFRSKTSSDLAFKSLVAGSNITITPAADTITISALTDDKFNKPVTSIASASVTDLTVASTITSQIEITGSETINSFSVPNGSSFVATFTGSPIIANGASISTGTGQNLVISPGDSLIIRATANNVVQIACYSTRNIIFRATAQATTSGTSIDFTGISAGVRRITIALNGVSTNGVSGLLVQLGAGSVDVAGYASTSTLADTAVSTGNSTGGFVIRSVGAANTASIQVQIVNISGNTWVASHAGTNNSSQSVFGGGNKTLSGVLDRIRLTTVNGTDVFDAGSVNILLER
jgi:hypothetical protein